MNYKKISKSQIIKIVKSRPWFVQVFNGLPIFLHNMASSSGWLLKDSVGANYSHFFLRMDRSRASFYYDEKDLANIGFGYYKKINNLRQLGGLITSYRQTYFSLKKKSNAANTKPQQSLSLKDLVVLAGKFSRELTWSVGVAHAQEGISFVSEIKLKDILNKRNLNTHENFQLLSSPVNPSFLAISQNLLWQIKQSGGPGKKKLINKFLKDFGWIETNYIGGRDLTGADVLKKARVQKRPSGLSTLTKTRLAKKRLVKELTLNKNELFVIQTIEIASKWQDDRKKHILQSINRFDKVLKEISLRIGLPFESFKYICPGELIYKNLASKKFIKELALRYPKACYYALKNKVLVFSGPDAAFIEKQTAHKSNNKLLEIKGLVANKGRVVGKVRLCLTIDDIGKVKKGEVLVASMTRPEFFPAMQKAAGFVTDEGGVTSHASIISREMNKPCIIGTKIATEVFKDGDMVEVDANNGIVRKIK